MKRNKRHDTRNIDLFRSHGDSIQIKKEIGANAYNVLKKRLKDTLTEFMMIRGLNDETNDDIGIVKQHLFAKRLFSDKCPKLAFKHLQQAETKAKELSKYALLNEIYHTFIEVSHLDGAPDQHELIERMKQNNKAFLDQEKLNLVYAVVKKAYQDAEFNGQKVELGRILKENFSKFDISSGQGYSFKSLAKIAEIVDITGAHTRNYQDVEMFFIDKVLEAHRREGESSSDRPYHISTLYTIANIYLRKREFDQSLKFLDLMYEQMLCENKKHFDLNYGRYCILRGLNLNFRGEADKGLEVLASLFNIRKTEQEEILNAELVYIMILFQKGQLDQASKVIAKQTRTDKWYERLMGQEWLLHRTFIEILLHIELNNVDLVESRIRSFKRKYTGKKELLETTQAFKFLKLVQKYYNNPIIGGSDDFKTMVEESIEYRKDEQEDLFLMSYYAWLKSKMEKKNLYITTLELVRR
jgi:hypothetical protein